MKRASHLFAVLSVALLPVLACIGSRPAPPQPLAVKGPTLASPELAPLGSGQRFVEIVTPLYRVSIDTEQQAVIEIQYRVKGSDLAKTGQERPSGGFWDGPFRDKIRPQSEYETDPYDIGHLRAWRLSAGSPDVRWCNWMGACVPMNGTLNKGVFVKWENHVANLVREHGQAAVLIIPEYDNGGLIPSAFTCAVEATPPGVVTNRYVDRWRFPNDASVRGKDLEQFRVSAVPVAN